jgi:WD40 repeat protein
MSSSLHDPSAPVSLLEPERPYRGLTPYSEDDAALFFGREQECDIVIANMMASRLTLLYGASGVGKTSLLRAGVLHELQMSSRRNLADYGAPEFVAVYFNRWSADPVTALTRSIHESVAVGMGGQAKEPQTGSAGLVETLQRWTTTLDADLLIILDQFEEYFLYDQDDGGDAGFAGEFIHAVNRTDLRVSFLVTIREDALARLDRFKGRLPNLFGNYLRTSHLDSAAARAAIEKPLEAFNRLVAGDEPFTAEPELVQLLLDQVRIGKVVLGTAGRGMVEKAADQDVGHGIETPYLQLVLTRLWHEEVAAGSHRLRVETLRRLGGAQQIVHSHLNEALRALPARQQDVAAEIFHHLVTPSGTKIAHTARDLAGLAELPEVEVTSVLGELSAGDVRILRPVPPPAGQPRAEPGYEILHDVLAPAVLDWRASHVVAQAAEERLRQARRRLRRVGGVATALGILLIAAVAFAILAFYQGHQANAERQRALALTRLATSRQLITQASAALEDDPRAALLLGIAAQRIHNDAETRASLVNGLTATHYAGTLYGHHGTVNEVAISPVGRTLATASDDRTVLLWDLTDPVHPARIGPPLTGHHDKVASVTFSPDGRTLATGSTDKTVLLWDLTDQAHPARLGRPLTGHRGVVWSLAFSPDGRTLASASADHTILLWDVRHPAHPVRLGRPLTGHQDIVAGVAFSPDGRTLASASTDHTVLLWDVRDRTRPSTIGKPLAGHRDALHSVAFSPDGRTLASTSSDTTAILWDVHDRAHPSQIGKPLAGHHGAVFSAAFTRDGRIMVTGSHDTTAIVWDLTDRAHPGRVSRRLTGHRDAVTGVAFSPDGRTLASSSDDSTAIVWDLTDRPHPVRLGPPLKGHQQPVAAMAFSPDGRTLATGSDDKTVLLWDLRDRTHPVRLGPPLIGHDDAVTAVAFSPDGRTLATGSDDKTVLLWDLRDRTHPVRLGLPLREHHQGVSAVAFSPDGRTLASGSDDQTVLLWDLSDRTQPLRLGGPLAGHGAGVSAVAFSPDGQTLASGSDDQTVLLWDLDRLSRLRNPVAYACALTGRGLDQQEWADYIPGLPYENTCPASR